MNESGYVPDPRQPTTYDVLPGGDLGSGGTGGSGDVQVYEGRDPAPPDNPALAAVSFPLNGGPLTQWSIASQSWV